MLYQRFIRILRETLAARAVVRQLVRQQLILRYRRTILGYFWTLLNPLLMMSVTAVVFANLFKMDLHTFALFMFAGMVPWNLFSAMISGSSTTFLSNEGLIKKIYLPKLIFPLSMSLALLVDSVLSLVALFSMMLFIGAAPTWSLLFLPVAYLLVFIFAFGGTLIISVLTVFFRDLQHVVGILLQALFFLTPILYEKKSFEGYLGKLLGLNPIAPFIDLFRAPIRYGVLPDTASIAHAALLAAASLVLGMVFFLRQERNIVFRL